ncbi:M48 family metalloprotease [Salarchaeum sp. JOR-1]|uniref:M48 family metalloprotease n=1 Tax=Salarchaeum sp. JOR-1 TaxID=2599399 RepID=UPI0011985D4E|nr:M48 family metalloprotease [Salarchaeum sp. JOR-1]QDX39350.1 hypothetical protein FQU85_00015 [Salarchaeum sp. JOR-1]
MPSRYYGGETTKELPVSQDDARDRLTREITLTDITTDDDSTTGTYTVGPLTFFYDWTLEPASDGTLVRERWQFNTWTLLGFCSLFLLPLILGLLFLTLTTVGIYTPSSALSPGRIQGTSPTGLPIIAYYAGGAVCFALITVVFLFFYRVSNAPSPITNLKHEDADTPRTTASTATGISILLAAIYAPLTTPFIILATLEGPSIIFEYGTLLGTLYILSSLAALALLLFLARTNALHRLEFTHNHLDLFFDTDAERDDLVTPYRSVDATYTVTDTNDLLTRVADAADSLDLNIEPSPTIDEDNRILGEGVLSRFGLRARYEWRAEPIGWSAGDVRQFTVSETVYIARDYRYFFWLFGMLGAYTLLLYTGSIPGLSSFAVLFAPSLLLPLLALALFAPLPALIFPRGLDETDTHLTIAESRFLPAPLLTILYGLLTLGLAAVYLNTHYVVNALAILLVVASLIAATYYETLTSWFVSGIPSLQLPATIEIHATIGIVSAMPAMFLLAGFFNSDPAAYRLAGVLSLAVTCVAAYTCRRERHLAMSRFRDTLTDPPTSPVFRAGVYLLSITVAALGIGLPLLAARYVSQRPGVNLPTTLLVASGALYLLAGLLYQVTSGIWGITTLFTVSRPTTPDAIDLPADVADAQLRLYPGNVNAFFATSTGRTGYIFIPEIAVEELPADQLAALIAHEDAHASKYTDGWLSFYAPLLASLCLVGRNVLFTALNYSGRELRADRYAATKTSPDTFTTAFQKIRQLRLNDRLSDDARAERERNTRRAAAALTPLLPDTTSPPSVGSWFELLYGDYHMGKAHPAPDERLTRLQEDDTSGDDDLSR